MQPFNHSQQLPFRYFDSDMARKRPLVVSFRRIQKMTPNNFDNSVSICDIHRLDTKLRDNNEVMTMKIMSKYGDNSQRIAKQRNNHYGESQSCRNFKSGDKQRPQLDSLFDEKAFDPNHSDKGCVFPKEKFYGNAKLLSVNDDILRKVITDCDEDSFGQRVDSRHISYRNIVSPHHLKKIEMRRKNLFKNDKDEKKIRTITPAAADNKMIDGAEQSHKRHEMKNDFAEEEDRQHNLFDEVITTSDRRRKKKQPESEPTVKAFSKSSSAPNIFLCKKLSTCMENLDPNKISTSVSMWKVCLHSF